jgi:hypothetical protein
VREEEMEGVWEALKEEEVKADEARLQVRRESSRTFQSSLDNLIGWSPKFRVVKRTVLTMGGAQGGGGHVVWYLKGGVCYISLGIAVP